MKDLNYYDEQGRTIPAVDLSYYDEQERTPIPAEVPEARHGHDLDDRSWLLDLLINLVCALSDAD